MTCALQKVHTIWVAGKAHPWSLYSWEYGHAEGVNDPHRFQAANNGCFAQLKTLLAAQRVVNAVSPWSEEKKIWNLLTCFV